MKTNEKQELLDKIEELKRKVKQLDKKKGRFIPEKSGNYWFVSGCGYVYETTNARLEEDKYLISIGNCFQTKEEASEYKEKLIFNQSVIDRIAELNEDWKYESSVMSYMLALDEDRIYIDYWVKRRYTFKEKLFKSKEIGETILKEFDNDKLIKWFI